MRRHRMLRACRMGRNQIPDYNPQDGSFRVGGGIAGSQDMVGQALDNVLTGFSPGWSDTHPSAQEGLGPLEALLYQVPLPVLRMFRPFTWGTADSDWDDQYTAVQDILKTFRPKTVLADRWREWLDGVAANFGGAAGLTLAEVLALWKADNVARRSEWVTDFETKTGLNIDEGAVKFLQSLKAQQQANRLDWITDFETQTGLNVDEGPLKFLQSLLAKMKPEWDKDTTPIADRIKGLIDGWANAHDGGTGTDRPLQDAIDAWLENMRTAAAAKESADRANLGVAAIRAEQAGGWSDEFAYSEAAKLDAAKYQEYRSGNANQSWGPDGKGVLTYRPNATVVGLDPGQIIYREKLRPIAGADGSVYVRLTKPPKALSQAAAFICWHMDVTGACNRFEVKYNKVQLQTVDAVGAVTNVGAAKTIPTLVAGDALEVKWTGARVQFMRHTGGNIITDVDMAYTPNAGTFVGFGGFVPVYVGVGGAIHPAPDFGGITASPKGI